MSKNGRGRAGRSAGAPNTGTPASQVFPDFPYERKFTHAEIHGDILPRSKRIGDAMRDGVAPNGAVLWIPGDLFELWMIHAALAGVDVDEDKAYIRARRLPDQSGRFSDAVEWVLKKEDTPEALAKDADAEAEAILSAIDQDLRPEVREAIRRRLYTAATEVRDKYQTDDPNAAARRDAPRDFGPPRLVQFRPDTEHPEEGQP